MHVVRVFTHHRAFAVGGRRVQYQADILVRAGVTVALPLAIVARRIEQRRIAQVEGLMHKVLAIGQFDHVVDHYVGGGGMW